jgi:hypothetical protein
MYAMQHGLSPLDIAVKSGNIGIVRLLLIANGRRLDGDENVFTPWQPERVRGYHLNLN